MTQRAIPGPSVAVLLNGHAKQVTPAIRGEIASRVGPEHVFLSESVEGADSMTACVLDAGYPYVFAAGGDGTFVGWVNRIVAACARRGRPLPRLGILPLGTGNALASHLGTSAATWRQDFDRFLRGEVTGHHRLHLVDCEGRHTPFAGAGTDAAVIHDYDWIRHLLRDTPLRRLASGGAAFALGATLRTIPRGLVEAVPGCEIVNEGAPAHRLDAEGRPDGPPVPAGGLLYRGPCMMAAASTVPFYGLGMRAFPFAGRTPGTLHLRVVARIPVATIVLGLRRIWTGAFRHPGLLDFEAERVTVRFDRPTPLQVGGDAVGPRETFGMGVVEEPIEVVDFSR